MHRTFYAPLTEHFRGSWIYKLVCSTLRVVIELLHMLSKFQLRWLNLVIKIWLFSILINGFTLSFFCNPFFESAIKNLYVLMFHRLEHPGGSISKKLHISSVITDDSICKFDVENFHSIWESLFVRKHKGNFGRFISQIIYI